MNVNNVVPTRLKKIIAAVLFLTFLLVACQRTEEKDENATEKIPKTNHNLTEARREVRAAWREAWLKFKRDNDMDISDNERRIAELREEVGKANTRFRATYSVRIDELERRNNELRDRTDNYKDGGGSRWVAFKNGSKRDMDDLKSLLKKTTIRNS